MSNVLKQLVELESLTTPELKTRWGELFDSEPPGGSRAYLVKRLCHRVQELAYGGVSDATRAHLRKHLEDVGLAGEGTERARRAKNGQPITGTRFTREWHGERHEVTVVDGGFEYEGRPYRSLSAVAREITGAHWNGPLFFGLRSRKGGK